jgi:hypothetical protein
LRPIRCSALMFPMTSSTAAATHLTADRCADAAHLAADSDGRLPGVVVAAIAFVDVDEAGPGQRFQVGNP